MRSRAILCVDDEAIILVSLISELRKVFGDQFLYEKAIDAEMAFRVMGELHEEGIELVLVISDWLMPGMRGDEFLEKVRIMYPQIHAIMITGHANSEALARVETNPNIIAVFEKPWNQKQLVQVIKEHCGGPPESEGCSGT